MINFKTISTLNEELNPRRILKYVLLHCKDGSTTLMIDDKEYRLYKDQVITITSGQIHFIKELNGALSILEFTLDFFCKDDNDIELIFHNGLFCHFGMNEIITLKDPKMFSELCRKINNELIEKPYQYLISIRSYIELLLVEINRTKIENGDEIWKPDALFLNFLEHVRKHFKDNYNVSQFADKLHTTELKLNELSKLHTDKTAQNVIYSLVVSEAKRMLIYQKISIKEIAFELGFNDPYYFSNFFKKYTNTSPKSYRKTHSL
ncbi:helix-turn-helix transcriptional regulator [Galbibacter sp. EGI 63066]|uniref:AraC family transcriptional regulator n=1 Tax=Galbibacter sp. EGI 63066 TaxID=2993559 RepID=UPI0022498E11|nr:helix-turn-helix transcriptional regulator [Galbibacter sp. EGI 63066]MCX2679647.1 helix-turn-helix transcriptional regulator [Galbibacter sp. EGI 63066]